MRVLCVIPARIGSTRLPEKPLRTIAGVPLVRLVAERVRELGVADGVVVATDDLRVMEAVADAGIDAVLTEPSHRSGTERVAEVVRRPGYRGAGAILNVQGDEPFVSQAALAGALAQLDRYDIGTAAGLLEPGQAGDPHRVKVAVDGAGRARAFVRRLPRGETGLGWHHHVGVYAYTAPALERWVMAPPVLAEQTERLEQLRALAAGLTIGVAVLPEPVPVGIDTEDDLRTAEQLLAVMSRG